MSWRRVAAATVFSVLGTWVPAQFSPPSVPPFSPRAGDGIAPSVEPDHAAAGSVPEYFVRLHPSVFPDREALLQTLRGLAIRRAPARDWDRAIQRLEFRRQHAQRSVLTTASRLGARITHRYWLVAGFAAEMSAGTADQLADHPAVARIEPAGACQLHMRWATDGRNHGADMIQQQYKLLGAGSTLAVLDGGIDADYAGTRRPHPAFNDKNGATRLRAAIGIANAGDTEDATGHGTAVASVALGRRWRHNADDGFAPDAGLVSYKLTSGSSRVFSTTIATTAFQRVLTDRIRLRIEVMNSSFGGASLSDPFTFAQIAADSCAYYGDIVHVTSAGNSGGSLFPTIDSQSNCNGLAVGATDVKLPNNNGSHAVLPSSSNGPLHGDPERDFPDLAAVGQVLAAQADRHDLQFWRGTSFSAPMVAGSALLLRGGVRWLSSLDVRALLLNNTESIRGDNPGKTKQHYGAGFLRTDLSVRALLDDRLMQSKFPISQNSGDLDFTVPATDGQTYTATLCWPRVAFDNVTPWDNLDLLVYDPSGQLLAESKSPRNLHERVVFRARSTGNYTVRVRLANRNVPSRDLPFSLAFGRNDLAGRQLGTVERYGRGCTGSVADPAFGLVLPPDGIGYGGRATQVPFAFTPCRVQQGFSHAQIVQSGGGSQRTLTGLALRRDDAQGDSPGFDVEVSMWLGYTERAPDLLSNRFDSNFDEPRVSVVKRRTVRFPPVLGLSRDPGQWDYVIPFDQPFVLNTGTGRNLIWETAVHAHSAPRAIRFDASARPDSVRLFGNSPTATTGTPNDAPLIVTFLHAGLPRLRPQLDGGSLPQLGEPLTVVLRHAVPGQTAIWLLGGSRTAWGQVRLPLDMGIAGAPSCLLLAAPDVASPGVTARDGSHEVHMAMPNDRTLTGVELFGQFAVGDPQINSLGVTVTNGLRIQVGG